MMPRFQTAPQGPTLSRMVCGTWRMLDEGAITAQEINRRLNICLDLGITTIDTAEIYGLYRVEAALGEVLALSPGLRDRLEIVTKAGIYVPHSGAPGVRTGHYDASGARLIASVDQALRQMQTDRLDLFLVHRPDWLTGIDDTAEGLNALLASGKIGHAGVSNYTPSQFAALQSRLDRPLATNQVEFSLLHMDPMFDGSFDQAQETRTCPMAWSPLAGGKLFGAATAPAAGRLAAEAARLAEAYDGASLEQLAYAWVMAHPARPLPVIGTNRTDRIRSAARAADLRLAREDWFALWVAAKGHGIP